MDESKHEDDIREFLEKLMAQFKGRCYLGQYASEKLVSTAWENGIASNNSPTAGSVVVTLEPPNKLVLGAFVKSGIDRAWEYWEGEFGPSELAAHRDSLGWDGHSLEALTACFTKAVEDATQPLQPQHCPAAGDGDTPAALVADEHHQHPPEFSNASREEGCVDRDGEAVRPGKEEPEAAAASAWAVSGTLDLHYAGAGIVGSWKVSRVQGGISAALMNSIHRSIRAACGGWQPGDAPKAQGNTKASKSRLKPSGTVNPRRKRVAATGAKLLGAGSSGDS